MGLTDNSAIFGSIWNSGLKLFLHSRGSMDDGAREQWTNERSNERTRTVDNLCLSIRGKREKMTTTTISSIFPLLSYIKTTERLLRWLNWVLNGRIWPLPLAYLVIAARFFHGDIEMEIWRFLVGISYRVEKPTRRGAAFTFYTPPRRRLTCTPLTNQPPTNVTSLIYLHFLTSCFTFHIS